MADGNDTLTAALIELVIAAREVLEEFQDRWEDSSETDALDRLDQALQPFSARVPETTKLPHADWKALYEKPVAKSEEQLSREHFARLREALDEAQRARNEAAESFRRFDELLGRVRIPWTKELGVTGEPYIEQENSNG